VCVRFVWCAFVCRLFACGVAFEFEVCRVRFARACPASTEILTAPFVAIKTSHNRYYCIKYDVIAGARAPRRSSDQWYGGMSGPVRSEFKNRTEQTLVVPHDSELNAVRRELLLLLSCCGFLL
jgi:hypothetical protein